MIKYSKVDDIKEIRKSYESEEAVRRLDSWYKFYKENNFFDFISNRIALNGIVLEVGGGTGFQGKIISNFTKGLYVHSDYSFFLCNSAKKKGLATFQTDGLNLAISDKSIDVLIAVELSTIIRSESLRYSQFKEFATVLKKDGYLCLITSLRFNIKKGHCIDKNDIRFLKSQGFKKEDVLYLGMIPGRFWTKSNASLFASIERLLSKFSIGLRKIVILKK